MAYKWQARVLYRMKRAYECTLTNNKRQCTYTEVHHEVHHEVHGGPKRKWETVNEESVKRARLAAREICKRTASMELNNPSKRQRVSTDIMDEILELRRRVHELSSFQQEAYKVIAGQTARIRQLEHMSYSSPNQMHICQYVAAR